MGMREMFRSRPRGRRVPMMGLLTAGFVCLATAPAVMASSPPSITGTVTDTSTPPAPLANICVSARPSAGGAVAGHAKTNATGAYSIPAVAAGTYVVKFVGCPSPYWVYQYYNDQYSTASANPVTVTAGVTTAGINAQLVLGGQITGSVTDNSSPPVPLANMCVSAVFGGGGAPVLPSVQGSTPLPTSFATQTNSTGGYVINGVPAGPYNMGFTDCHKHKYLFVSGSSFIQVNAGATTASVNAVMGLPGQITGTVTNGSAPLKGICITIPFTASATTNSSGVYTLSKLTPGSYQVGFIDCLHHKYLPQWWQNQPTRQTATYVTVNSGMVTSHIDAVLSLGGKISGVVTNNTKPYVPIAGMCVNAVPNPYNAYGTFGNATTNAKGGYTMKDLASGSYTVSFNSCGITGWGSETYPVPVNVVAPGTTGRINGRLPPA